MTEETPTPAQPPVTLSTSPKSSRLRWLAIPLVLVLLGAAVLLGAYAWLPTQREQPGQPSPPFDVQWAVAISSADRAKNEVHLEEHGGALPVRAGEWMRITVQISEPAYCYLLWIDGPGNVVPMYPWNDGSIEVKDANTPPPERRPTKVIFSPVVISSGWTFDRPGGLDTVLLLVRRTPPEQDLRLGDLLAGMAATRMRSPTELTVLRFDRDQSAAATVLERNRGSAAEVRAIDGPLLERLEKLRERFELVRAVRFAHEPE